MFNLLTTTHVHSELRPLALSFKFVLPSWSPPGPLWWSSPRGFSLALRGGTPLVVSPWHSVVALPSWFLPGTPWWHSPRGFSLALRGGTPLVISPWPSSGTPLVVSPWPSMLVLPIWPSLWSLAGRSSQSLAGRSSWSLPGPSLWCLPGCSPWHSFLVVVVSPSSLMFLLLPTSYLLCFSLLFSLIVQ
jgi:hypothetical protein